MFSNWCLHFRKSLVVGLFYGFLSVLIFVLRSQNDITVVGNEGGVFALGLCSLFLGECFLWGGFAPLQGPVRERTPMVAL